MQYNTLNKQNRQDIEKRAKEKKNGVYTLRGIYYRVHNGRVTHYAYAGIVIEACGHFDVTIGLYDYMSHMHSTIAKQCLLKI